jgi:bacterioferritin-associated ferredoxin
MYVCLCNGVTERDVRAAVEAGAETVDEVAYCTGAGKGCGTCVRTIAAMIGQDLPEPAAAHSPCVRLRVLTSAA